MTRAAGESEMDNFNSDMAGLGLFSKSFPCAAPWLRASQARCVQPLGNGHNLSPPQPLVPALHVSSKGLQRWSCGFCFPPRPNANMSGSGIRAILVEGVCVRSF